MPRRSRPEPATAGRIFRKLILTQSWRSPALSEKTLSLQERRQSRPGCPPTRTRRDSRRSYREDSGVRPSHACLKPETAVRMCRDTIETQADCCIPPCRSDVSRDSRHAKHRDSRRSHRERHHPRRSDVSRDRNTRQPLPVATHVAPTGKRMTPDARGSIGRRFVQAALRAASWRST